MTELERICQRMENTLATYNAEVARGIVHTPEWKEKIAVYQTEWDQMRASLTGGLFYEGQPAPDWSWLKRIFGL